MPDLSGRGDLPRTVEEQWEQSLVDAKAQGNAWAELVAANKKPSLWSRFRSAVTGLFVSKKYAEANPDTTVREKA